LNVQTKNFSIGEASGKGMTNRAELVNGERSVVDVFLFATKAAD
jgi:hypothetical protein